MAEEPIPKRIREDPQLICINDLFVSFLKSIQCPRDLLILSEEDQKMNPIEYLKRNCGYRRVERYQTVLGALTNTIDNMCMILIVPTISVLMKETEWKDEEITIIIAKLMHQIILNSHPSTLDDTIFKFKFLYYLKDKIHCLK